MTLIKFEDYYPNYRDKISDRDRIKNYHVVVSKDETNGLVEDILVEAETGQFRY